MLRVLAGRSDAVVKIDRAFRRVEKITAVGALIGGLEVLRVGTTYADNGLNSWPITRTRLRGLNHGVGRLIGWAVRYPRVLGVAGVRAASAALLLVPGLGTIPRALGLAGAVGSGALLHLRTNYGNDGSDHFAVINFTSALVEKAFAHDQRARQLTLGFVAAQSALSYSTSGVVKLGSPIWRSGEALTGILRTGTYGDSQLYGIFRDRPRLSIATSWAVMLFETSFPLVFVLPKPLSHALLAGAGAFHLVNARYMGLNRFLWSFMGAYPAVVYFADLMSEDMTAACEWGQRHKVAVSAGCAVAGSLVMIWCVFRGGVRRDPHQEEGTKSDYAPGVWLDVPTGTTHALVEGADDGQPVIFESALATPCTGWSHVVAELDDRYRTVCHDRAGNGWSPQVAKDQMSASFALDRSLAVLASTGERPTILVGHSVGGLLALMTASQAPDRVCGLVLVDASHPHQLQRSNAQREGVPMVAQGIHEMLSPRRRRALVAEDLGAIAELPVEVRDATVGRLRQAAPWRGALAELRAWKEEWSEAAARAKLPADLPLAVVTAGEQEHVDPIHGQLQEEYASMSSVSRHLRVDGASHDGLVLSARYSSTVVEAIHWVHNQVLQSEQVRA